MALTEAELGYAAALLDGEGCIVIKGRKESNGMYVEVSIANTYYPIHEWLSERFGGCIAKMSSSNTIPCYQWKISTSASLEFLKLVRPYMIIKARQADVAILLQSWKASKNHKTDRLTDNDIEFQNLLKEKITSLKKGLD